MQYYSTGEMPEPALHPRLGASPIAKCITGAAWYFIVVLKAIGTKATHCHFVIVELYLVLGLDLLLLLLFLLVLGSDDPWLAFTVYVPIYGMMPVDFIVPCVFLFFFGRMDVIVPLKPYICFISLDFRYFFAGTFIAFSLLCILYSFNISRVHVLIPEWGVTFMHWIEEQPLYWEEKNSIKS